MLDRDQQGTLASNNEWMPSSLSKSVPKQRSIYTLNVRSYLVEDCEAVKKICRSHIRSLCFAAVAYYLCQHYRDMIVYALISKIFLSWRQLLCTVSMYLFYTFARAVAELEWYLHKDCPDLDDILSYYFQSANSHFWVAEYKVKTQPHDDASSHRDAYKPSEEISTTSEECKLVGCVGCRPTRDDPKVAQLLRLVVDKNARRMRFGSRLLAQFELFAIEKGFREVRLFTNNLNTSHIKFIRQHGYEIVQTVPRSLMRGALLQWKKILIYNAPQTITDCRTNQQRSSEVMPASIRARSLTSVMD